MQNKDLMNCLFVYFSIDTTETYSHSVAILSAVAKQAKFDVDLLIVKDRNYEEYVRIASTKKPDIVAFSLTSLYWSDGVMLASKIKENMSIPLWVGGSHINALPESFYESPFDAACYGDGENIFKKALIFLRGGSIYHSPNWLVKNSNTQIQPNVIDYIDEYPIPYIQLFPKETILEYPSLFFSKGCIFSCNYCMSRKGGYAHKVRWKTTQRAIDECIQLVEYCNPTELYFDDDTFIKDISWVTTFLQAYSEKVKIPFYCNSRPELLSDKVCKLLSDNYCRGVGIGIESGSERIRKDILGRHISNEQIKSAFSMCKSYGLETWSFNMVNTPSETVEDLEKSIEINSIVNPDYIRISIFTPFPGSPMYEPQDSYDSYFSKNYLKIDSCPKRKMIEKWIKDLEEQGKLWND